MTAHFYIKDNIRVHVIDINFEVVYIPVILMFYFLPVEDYFMQNTS
jgi:hypothetical protein